MDKKRVKATKYLYGPVPSRRLGLSLGVDIVPPKICTLDCVYCQIGRTTEKSAVRRDFLDIQAVLSELRERLEAGVKADYITIGGSGEPTLNSRLGELIDGIRELTDVPVAIITNGTLLYRADVRAECAKADVVVPSLDAGDPAVFEAVNRPAPGISIEKLVSGLCEFREEFSGQIWLEVFLVAGVNTDGTEIAKIKDLIRRIRPDRVQLNTAVRPAAEEGVQAVGPDGLADIAREIGGGCEIVGAPPASRGEAQGASEGDEVLSMLKRRPCSVDDICTGLGVCRNAATAEITRLLGQGTITSERRGGTVYYCLRADIS